MINPVLLVETGDSYEAANITRWLDMNSTCPLTGQQLQSKQLSSNRALKNLIADWAAAHGFVLPAAPTYMPAQSGSASPATTSVAAAAPSSMPHTVLSVRHHGGSRSGSASKRQIFQCSRTWWAVAALALLVALGVAIGTGVGLAMKQSTGRILGLRPSHCCFLQGHHPATVTLRHASSSRQLSRTGWSKVLWPVRVTKGCSVQLCTAQLLHCPVCTGVYRCACC
jgi:hypothetical protein